jgi:hypothetical protein
MRYFCTYFDQRYLPRGLAMYESLRQHCPQFRLWVLCLDAETHNYLKEIKRSDLEAIPMEEFEHSDELLKASRKNRSLLEYYFTCTPSLPLFIFEKNPAVDLLTYLDADLYFFAPPDSLFDEIADHSIAIIPHRFPPLFRKAERNGIYNVGWVSFRRDRNGLACLQRWRRQCIERCVDSNDETHFADQRYLDDWPSTYRNLIVIQHKGANLAAWNIANYEIAVRDEKIYVDNEPLLFFHFHGLRPLNRRVYDTCFQHYGAKLSPLVLQKIYRPYLKQIAMLSNKRNPTASLPPLARGSAPKRSAFFLVRVFDLLKHLLQRHYLIDLGGRML